MTALVVSVPGATGAPFLVRVSTDPYTGGGAQHQTEVEPDVAAYGNTAVSAFQVGRFGVGGGSMNTGWATLNKGTWQHGTLPAFTTASSPAGSFQRTADNTVAYDAVHGTWLISSLGIRQAANGHFHNDALVVSRSPDGLTWSGPVVVSSALQPDKDWLDCDDWPSSPGRGTCYAAWSDLDAGVLLQVSRSTDGGQTWSAPVATANRATGYNVQVAARPNGDVVLVATQGSNLIASGSTDHGESWSAPVVIAQIQHRNVTGGVRVEGSKPTVRVDAQGIVYAIWSDCRFRTSCRSNDLVLSTSSDGANWSAVTRIPIDAATSLADYYLPGLGVDPATGGSSAHLGLVYYFYKDATCATPCGQMYAGFIASTNGGSSWQKPIVLAGPMSIAWLPQSGAGMVGDYDSVAYVAGKPLTVIAIAAAPKGGTLDEAMYAVSPSQSAGGSRLVATVGPGRAASLSAHSGSPGAYVVVVHDRTRGAGFHLKGPGVNRSTSRGFVGTVTWHVRLRAGTYRYFSDARGGGRGPLVIR
jgi:hypothetical protein